jgi:glutaredoxin 3|tara:strand:+ start:1801 stop:2046 length:246 start_codon:yes stop_codon:yes gene_type:complete
MKIEIYSKPACPFCDKALFLAQQVVQESSHSYNKYMLDEDFTREELFEKFPTARTFPQITIDGESIGGYTEFEAFIKENKY